MNLTCDWCGESFQRRADRGPVPKYCSPSHRQRAYEARRAMTRPSDAIAGIGPTGSARLPSALVADAHKMAAMMEAATAPMRDAIVSMVTLPQLDALRREALQTLTTVARTPAVDLSSFARLPSALVADAHKMAAMMEAATAPMRDAIASMVTLPQLDALRREALQTLTTVARTPDIDALLRSAATRDPIASKLGTHLTSQAVRDARLVLDDLATRPLIKARVKDLVEARGAWEEIEADLTPDALADVLDLERRGPTSNARTAGAAASIVVLLAIEGGSSRVLLDFVLFSLNTVWGVTRMTWQIASLPSIAAPIYTIGGLAAIATLLQTALRTDPVPNGDPETE